jgi:hypothetical protein
LGVPFAGQLTTEQMRCFNFRILRLKRQATGYAIETYTTQQFSFRFTHC